MLVFCLSENMFLFLLNEFLLLFFFSNTIHEYIILRICFHFVLMGLQVLLYYLEA